MSIDTPQVRTRRGSELFLVLVALGIGVAAYTIIGFALNDAIPAGIIPFIAAMGGLGVGLHLVIRKFAPTQTHSFSRSPLFSTTLAWP